MGSMLSSTVASASDAGVYRWYPASKQPTSLREARTNCDRFVSLIPERVSELKRYVHQNSGVSLEFDKATMVELGRFLDKRLVGRIESEEEFDAEKQGLPDWIHKFISDVTLDATSISLCIDSGIFFGETLRTLHPHLFWAFVRKPPSDLDLFQPALFPFKVAHLNPVRTLLTVGLGALEGRRAEERIPQLFDTWSDLVKNP